MSTYIDLSHPINNVTPVHKYDREIKLYLDRTIKEHRYNNSRLEIGMHAGTHIDISSHLIDNNSSIAEVDIEKFVGPGKLIDVRGKNRIKKSDVVNQNICPNDIAVFFTGHSDNYYRADYFNQHPIFEKDLIDFLIEQKIKMLGIDSPSPDKFPFESHIKLFSNNILILENLTNLGKLINVQRFEIFAFPLKIQAEASLVRAVAKID